MRRALLTLAIVLGMPAALPLGAQGPEPRRPQLDAALDTNDWQSYYQAGVERMPKLPAEAADAFYWAHRLDPSRPEPLYGRWAALRLVDRSNLVQYFKGASYVAESMEGRTIDSLRYAALMRHPFTHETFAASLVEAAMTEQYGTRWEWSADPRAQATLEYSEGKFDLSAMHLRQAMQKDTVGGDLRFALARALFMLRQYDRAADQLYAAVEQMNRRGEKSLLYFYDSRAMYLYAAGMAHLAAKRLDRAHDAFTRALAEDLSFGRAHAALGILALMTRDTVLALDEYSQAVQTNPTDAALRLDYGSILVSAHRSGDAAEQLAEAIALEPHYALPYYYHAIALENIGRRPEARAQYTTFLARAPARLTAQIGHAKERLKALEGN